MLAALLISPFILGAEPEKQAPDLHVTARFVSMKQSPGCGMFIWFSLAKYQVLVGPAELVGKVINVKIACAEMPGAMFGIDNGDRHLLMTDEVRDLVLTRANFLANKGVMDQLDVDTWYLRSASRAPGFTPQVEFEAEWSAACRFHDTPFGVHFKSPSGDPTEDDMVVSIRWAGGKPFAVETTPALFVPVRFSTNAKNACEQVGAFDWSDHSLLLLVARDDRPAWDSIRALVIDSRTGQLIQDAGDLAGFHDGLVLLKTHSGYRVLVHRRGYQDANDFGEFWESDWLSIINDRGKLRHQWETTRK